jgi:CRISPR-associated protein Cmr3
MNHDWLFIQPEDVWMFRDSKPFAAQQSFVARSMFPPTPQTMQGIIRSHVLEQAQADWAAYARGEVDKALKQKIGVPAHDNQPASFGELNLVGPFVARQKEPNGKVERLVPAPLDLVTSKEGGNMALLMPPHSRPAFLTEPPFEGWMPLVAPDNMPSLKEADGWLDEEGLATYLGGGIPQRIEEKDKPSRGILKNKEVFEHEPRVGLALEKGKRVARDRHLYHAHFVRPQAGIGLLVGVNSGFVKDAKGVIGIGGESRFGSYQVMKDFSIPQTKLKDNSRLKVVLLTPTYFKNGWGPENNDWSRWVGAAGKLVSMAIGKPKLISGWDVAKREPKPLYHFVPAGSVYLFENATWQEKAFTETPDGELDYSAMGFGGCALGQWNKV